MTAVLKHEWGNPSSIHLRGRNAKKLLDRARGQVAAAINADPDEIFFTSGGSEANSWALGCSGTQRIITSEIEHHSVLNCCESLSRRRRDVRYIPVTHDGIVDMALIEQQIVQNNTMVSIMLVNNELGTIQPVKQIGEICRTHNAIFHSDAVQALGNMPIDVKTMNVQMLSLSGHKFNAPQGVGALYIRRGVSIEPLIFGGQQEKHMRGGTESLASIVAMGVAAEMASKKVELTCATFRSIIEGFITRVLTIPGSRMNGSLSERIAGTVNFSFAGVEGQTLVLWLNRHGIYASAGSACDSDRIKPSHVIEAIKVPEEYAVGSVRFSFSETIRDEELEYIHNTLVVLIEELRKM